MNNKKESVRAAQYYSRRLAEHNQCFFAKDGSVFCSLAELLAGLKRMRPDIFDEHANDKKCDFAAWVKDVIGDQALARSLEKTKTSQNMMVHRLATRLRKLDKDLAEAAEHILHPDPHHEFHMLDE